MCHRKKNSICCFLWTLGPKEFGEWISLVDFHGLIDENQKDCNNEKEQKFYPQRNGVFFNCCFFFLDFC